MKTKENKGQLEVNKGYTDTCKDVKPADIPYDKYMEVVRENEDLKEIIVKLVRKLNECKFFD